jgi:hypothetical protein
MRSIRALRNVRGRYPAISLGNLTATATYNVIGAYPEGPFVDELPSTFTASSYLLNDFQVSVVSSAGGNVTIVPDAVPSGMFYSGGTNTCSFQFYGWNYGSQPATGTHVITLNCSDGFGNNEQKVLTIIKRDVWPKAAVRYVMPRVQGTSAGLVENGVTKASVTGTVTLDLKIGAIFAVDMSGSDLTVQWYKNGVTWGSPQAGNLTKAWNTALEENRAYAITVEILSADDPLPSYRPIPGLFLVSGASAPTPPYDVPVVDLLLRQIVDTQISHNASAGIDYVNFSGTRPRRTDDHPYTYQTAQRAIDADDQVAMKTHTNWFLEGLTHHRTTWFDNYTPAWVKDPAGVPYVGVVFPRIANYTEDAIAIDRRHPWYDGPRNDNNVSPYSTFYPLPDGGWMGIQIDGRMFRVKTDGTVVTVAGNCIAASTTAVPYDARATPPNESSVPFATVQSNQITKVGDWSGYSPGYFNQTNDLHVVPGSNFFSWYVADAENHRIALVTFSETTNFTGAVITTYKDLTGYAADAKPVRPRRVDAHRPVRRGHREGRRHSRDPDDPPHRRRADVDDRHQRHHPDGL